VALLALNAGSSTLKFSLVDAAGDRSVAQGLVETASRPAAYSWSREDGPSVSDSLPHASVKAAMTRIVDDMRSVARSVYDVDGLDSVVHRIVHGGSRFTEPVVVTGEVLTLLESLAELAPLHNRPAVEVIDAALERLPDVPHVAVFDTAFHSTLPPEAFTYPLPMRLNERWGLRRFGFHGLNHAYCARRGAEILRAREDGLCLIVAHLGSGASVSAIRDGRSVDTSMGFTPLEGLMMGTRSGSIDPGLLLHLQLECGMSTDELFKILYRESGLLGLSGVSADMREVIAASGKGHGQASLAIRTFAHRARQAIGAAAVTLGRVDALVFTGGIGEHADTVRALICHGLSCLGFELDAALNASARSDAVISSPNSRPHILVITAREDLMMARLAALLLRRGGSASRHGHNNA
jgi:acetate kinase